jgi:type II restriction enzyme
MDKRIELAFKKFIMTYGEKAFLKLSSFLNEFRNTYENEKMTSYQSQGISISEAQNKARNSWVAYVGNQLENLVVLFLDEFCKKHNLKVIKGDLLKRGNLDYEPSRVRRNIEVNFNQYSLLPDADIVIYKTEDKDINILAIISVKNSFRERYTETPYWKLKLMQDEVTRPIKVFMVTPDNDNEISFIGERGPRQPRIVMEYELDSIYLAREDFDPSNKVKGLDQLLKDLSTLVQTKI